MHDLLPWLRLIFRHKGRLWLGGLLMFATLAAGIGLLGLSGWFITATALTGLLITSGIAATLDVYVPGGGIRFFALTRTVSRYFERLYNHDTVLRLLADIRVRYFQGLAERPAERRDKGRSSDSLNRLTTDIEALDNLYLRLLAPGALAVLSTLLAALVMVFIAPQLLWALLPLALLPVVLARLAWRTYSLTLDLGEEQQALRGRLVDVLEGHEELAAAHLWPHECEGLVQTGQRMDQRTLVVENELSDAQGLVLGATQLSVFLALIIGLGLWRDGALSGPVALMFTLGLFGLAEAFTNLPAAFARVGQTIGAARRLNRDTGLVDTAASDGAAPTYSQPPISKGLLTLDSLSRSINGEPLFAPLTLTLGPGEHLAIVGPSGCGKSSVLDMIAGLSPAGSGSIRVDGLAPEETTSGEWLAGISCLEQTTWFSDTTVASHLRMADPGVSDERLWDVLHAVDLDELVASLPRGLGSPLGDQAERFSGGERRRLALARTLLKPARLILLDEPFTGLDRDTADTIRQRIKPWLAGKTCIMVAHDAHALPAVDRVVAL